MFDPKCQMSASRRSSCSRSQPRVVRAKEDKVMVRSILALVTVLAATSTGLAGDLVTPPVFVGAGTNVACRLTNITSGLIPAQFKLIGVGGTVLADSTPITVEAGDIVGFSINAPTQRVYCRFVKASRSKVRAVIATFSDADDHTDHVLAVAQ
jgi:hypothetical protein